LVLLSHNETGFDGTLEIDGDSRSSDWLDKSFVNPHESVPGPLVLLTGCETSRPRDSLSSVVAEFLYGGAAVVIGTLAKIDYRASTTKQIVVALQGVLSEEKDLEDRSVGEVIRQTRCALLRKGDLTGLNLVAYGDANWKFKKEETA
jgi:hypothetical protein